MLKSSIRISAYHDLWVFIDEQAASILPQDNRSVPVFIDGYRCRD